MKRVLWCVLVVQHHVIICRVRDLCPGLAGQRLLFISFCCGCCCCWSCCCCHCRQRFSESGLECRMKYGKMCIRERNRTLLNNHMSKTFSLLKIITPLSPPQIKSVDTRHKMAMKVQIMKRDLVRKSQHTKTKIWQEEGGGVQKPDSFTDEASLLSVSFNIHNLSASASIKINYYWWQSFFCNKYECE